VEFGFRFDYVLKIKTELASFRKFVLASSWGPCGCAEPDKYADFKLGMAPGRPSGMKMVADVPNDMKLSKSVIHEIGIEVREAGAGIILERVAGNDASDVSVAWLRRESGWRIAIGRLFAAWTGYVGCVTAGE